MLRYLLKCGINLHFPRDMGWCLSSQQFAIVSLEILIHISLTFKLISLFLCLLTIHMHHHCLSFSFGSLLFALWAFNFPFKILFYYLRKCVYVCVGGLVHMRAGTCKGQKRALDSLELW